MARTDEMWHLLQLLSKVSKKEVLTKLRLVISRLSKIWRMIDWLKIGMLTNDSIIQNFFPLLLLTFDPRNRWISKRKNNLRKRRSLNPTCSCIVYRRFQRIGLLVSYSRQIAGRLCRMTCFQLISELYVSVSSHPRGILVNGHMLLNYAYKYFNMNH